MMKKRNRRFNLRPVRKPWGSFRRPERERLSVEILDERQYQFPELHITAEAHGKMRALIEACPIEVSWLATCSREGNRRIVIDNIFVPHQRCTPSFTLISEDGEAQLLQELLGRGLTSEIKRLNCWGHSHVNFSVFASGQDDTQTSTFVERALEMKKGFFVRLIANKYDDLYASLYLLDRGIIVHHCPITAEPAETGKWRKWAQRQVELKVKRMRVRRPKVVENDEEFIGGDFVFPFGNWQSLIPNISVEHGQRYRLLGD